MPEIDENDVQVVGGDTAIQYFVSSCLTVTCGFTDGSRIGAHFSHGTAGTNWVHADSVATWTAFNTAVTSKIQAGTHTNWVVVRGQIDMWKPSYLTTARLTTDYATPGNLSDTISAVTGRAPDIATQNESIVVMADGSVV